MPKSVEQLNIEKSQENIERKPDNLKVELESGLETLEDLKKLAQEKIESVGKELEELSGSEKRIEGCNNTVNLPANKLEEIKAISGVIEKLGAVNERGESLKKAFQEKMRILLAGLMITMGSADVGLAKASANSKIKSGSNIEEVIKKSELNSNETKEEISDEEKNLEEEVDDSESDNNLEKKEESLSSTKEEKDNQNIDEMEKRALECVEKVKSELIQHIGSPEFLKRLVIEYGGDEEVAKVVQSKDVENLKTVSVDALSLADIILKSENNKNSNAGGEALGAFYKDDPEHKITIPKDWDEIFKGNSSMKMSMEDTIWHELIHAATKAKVSKSAMEILENFYKKQGFLGLIKNKEDKYFSDSAERLEGKQVLDKQLEKLGIKRYGEEFTEEHFKKMMEAYKNGKFPDDAENFIKRTKKDPKIFKEIFDKIAKNEEGKEDLSSST